MWLYLLLIAVPVLVLVAFIMTATKDRPHYSWVQFFARGKDAAFSLKEIELLRRVAVKAELEDPVSLFWSVKQLDRCIRALLRKARLTGEDRSQETQDFLSKLYTYRKKIEFDQPRYKKGISGSRSIGETQSVRILVDGAGIFESKVIRNSDRFLTIAKPSGPKLPANFTWKGRRVAVYFWRRDDAGYVFDTYVLDEVASGGAPVLQLAHSDSLFRTQKRRSIRAKTQKSAYLYFPKEAEAPEKIEVEPGLRCIIEDLSEDGCSFTIGGKALAGLRVKVQFELDGEPLVMTGIVKYSDYDEDTNKSRLHVEADPLSLSSRNRILAEVFNVQPDGDLSSAFSIFDEEEGSEDLAESGKSDVESLPEGRISEPNSSKANNEGL